MADFLIMDDEKHKGQNQAEINKKSFIDNLNDVFYSLQKIKVKEKAVFYRLMSTMTNSGMGLVDSVSILEKQEKNKIFKGILQKIIEELQEGKNLSDCLELFPTNFDDSEIGMIRSGEKTGRLNTTLKDLAEQIEKIASISGKLKSAMMYPAFIVLVVFGVIFILMTMVVPKLLEIFGDKSTLPASTQTLMNISDFFTNYWFFMILGVIILLIAIIFWKKTPDGRYNFDSIMLKVPIFGEITKK